jgi:hypothetical protein
MLASTQSAEILARLLADPESFTVQEEALIVEFQTLKERALTPHQCARFEAALTASARFYLAVASLKLSLAEQGKVLGSS